MYLIIFLHASLHIIETLFEDAVTLRIDLSYIKIISVRLPRFRETFGLKLHGLPHICWFRRFYQMFYTPGINLTNSQILYHTFKKDFLSYKEG